MFPLRPLLSLILITLTSVDAGLISRTTGKATLSFVTSFKEDWDGTINLVEKDLARIQALKEAADLGEPSSTSFSIQNAYIYYTAQVGVGTPPTDYTFLVDTGSSNTWLGADKSYVKTSTSQDTGHTFSLRYGAGSVSGEEWNDTVTLAPGLVISEQSIGVANQTSGFSGIDGILGLGPVDLTRGSVNGMDTVPTVSDNLLSQDKISQEVLGVYFIPAAEKQNNGELTFGGIDESVISSPVVYVPLTETFPASAYWGINQTINYGDTIILPLTAGIVDTGSTLISIASDAFEIYQNMTGATMDSATGLLKITPEQYANLQLLTFNIGDAILVLTPNAQIWPRSLNTNLLGGVADAIYLIVGSLPSPSGSGFDFVNGYTFLERYYSVYDTTHGVVGFATTEYTFSEDN